MVTQMARAAVKSQTTNYQDRSTVLGNIGMMAGNGISKIFGLGAYKMKSNSLFDSHTSSQVPFMHSTDESVTFRHREYIADISSSVAFAAQQFQVNPGLSQSFPYLQSIASSFQEYKFKGLIYEFKSTGATSLVNGTNTAMGTVMLAAQYKADAPGFTSKVDLLNEMWSVDAKTSDSCILPIECSPKENPMSIQYVRTGAPIGDIKLYDLCNVTVATQGSQGANVVGELWVSYEVEFFKPAVTPTGGVLNAAHLSGTGNGNTPLGVAPIVERYNTLGVTITASNFLNFPTGTAGSFLIDVNYFGPAVVGVVGYGAVTLDSNMAPLNLFSGGPLGVSPQAGAAAPTNVCFQYAITLLPVGRVSTFIIANGNLPLGGVVEVQVIELPDSAA